MDYEFPWAEIAPFVKLASFEIIASFLSRLVYVCILAAEKAVGELAC